MIVKSINKRKRRTAQWSVEIFIALLLVTGCSAFAPGLKTRDSSQQQFSSTELRLFNSLLPLPLLRKTSSKNDNVQHQQHQQQEHLNGSNNNVNTNSVGILPINNDVEYSTNGSRIPFVVERLGNRPGDQVFRDIAEMCISVFFNDGKVGKAMPPWKEAQLSYLRLLQTADLKRRRMRDQRTNAMFVAYKVEEASSNEFQTRPLILDLGEVYNLNPSLASSNNGVDYVRGDVLGFCEVSMVPFGLTTTGLSTPLECDSTSFYYDEDSPSNYMNSQRMVPKRMRYPEVARPVLTNLSVNLEARGAGVGTRLLDACERAARKWGENEMVLEVEAENAAARKWYQKRGYRVLFSDPTSKRYDVNGLMLKKVKCTRNILRKSLLCRNPRTQVLANRNDVKSTFDNFGLGALRRLRDNVLQAANS